MRALRQEAMGRPLALRLDEKSRQGLNNLAKESQRQVSQLIRHALEEYLHSQKTRLEPAESALVASESEMKVITVRLSQSLEKSLERYARANGETVSEVARKAILSWIPKADLGKLGTLGGAK